QILSPAAIKMPMGELAFKSGFKHAEIRALKIGVDASLWIMQCCMAFRRNHAQAGESPELRTIFHRLSHFSKYPLIAVFVFDGPGRPHRKRGKRVMTTPHWLTSGMQEMIEAFGFYVHLAPGEAEAELAELNERGVIDAVCTEDVDALLFGAKYVLRNNPDIKPQFHQVCVYGAERIRDEGGIGLDRTAMIFIALCKGGDYDSTGLVGCGIQVAKKLALYGFGRSLYDAIQSLRADELSTFLEGWRERVREELRNDSQGFLGCKQYKIAAAVRTSFPNITAAFAYAKPLTSWSNHEVPTLPTFELRHAEAVKIARICERLFAWGTVGGIIKRFQFAVLEGVCVRRLCNESRRNDRVAAGGTRKAPQVCCTFLRLLYVAL
ncbi:PIN domain-like protein, partial [Gloeophyllum trabeum ATCC 11539]